VTCYGEVANLLWTCYGGNWSNGFWPLPVQNRVKFKLSVPLIYKSVHELTAPCLTNDCQLVTNSGCRRLRSS